MSCLVTLLRRLLYGTTYACAHVVWNLLGKHLWRMALQPVWQALRDVFVDSEATDAQQAGRASVSHYEAVRLLLVAIYNRTQQILGQQAAYAEGAA